jgi:3'-phosphoadenosine 5'-phosphosulfate (PAPS) 3'-phosphatase
MHAWELDDRRFEELLDVIREQGQWIQKTRAMYGAAYPGARFPHEMKQEIRTDIGTARMSPVTFMDKATHRVLCDTLARLSDLPVVSEEAAAGENLANSRKVKNAEGQPSYWVMDPIDRTEHVIDPEKSGYLIQLAQVIDGKAVEGILYYPEWDLFLYTRHGVAYRREGNGTATPLSITKPEALDSHVKPLRLAPDCYKLPNTENCAIVAPQDFVGVKERAVQLFPNLALTRLGARATKLEADPRFKDDLLVLFGRADLATLNSSGFEWDLAPHHALIEAAGGTVIDKYTGEPPRYGGRYVDTERHEPWLGEKMLSGAEKTDSKVIYNVTDHPMQPCWVGHPATLKFLGLSGHAPEMAVERQKSASHVDAVRTRSGPEAAFQR